MTLNEKLELNNEKLKAINIYILKMTFLRIFTASFFILMPSILCGGNYSISQFKTIRVVPQLSPYILPTKGNVLEATDLPLVEKNELLLRRKFSKEDYSLFIGKINKSNYEALNKMKSPNNLKFRQAIKTKFYETKKANYWNDIKDVYFNKFGDVFVVNKTKIFYKNNDSWLSVSAENKATKFKSSKDSLSKFLSNLHETRSADSIKSVINKLKGFETVYKYDNDGNKRFEGRYKNGKNEGYFIWWHPNGQKSMEGTGKNDKRDGKYTEWNESGVRVYVGHYINMKPTGICSTWHDNGKLFHTRDYKDNKEEGLSTWWYESGQKSREGKLIGDNIKEKKVGVYTHWHENGQKQKEGNYIDGIKDGLHSSWHGNGQMSSEVNYVNGKKDGLETAWNEGGRVLFKGLFKNGKKEGLYWLWYENGQRGYEGTFKNDKPQGTMNQWHENGKKASEGKFDSKGIGRFKHWDESGNLIKKSLYKNDSLISEEKF